MPRHTRVTDPHKVRHEPNGKVEVTRLHPLLKDHFEGYFRREEHRDCIDMRRIRPVKVIDGLIIEADLLNHPA